MRTRGARPLVDNGDVSRGSGQARCAYAPGVPRTGHPYGPPRRLTRTAGRPHRPACPVVPAGPSV